MVDLITFHVFSKTVSYTRLNVILLNIVLSNYANDVLLASYTFQWTTLDNYCRI